MRATILLLVAAASAGTAFAATALPAGSAFRDCSVCPEMVTIPAGQFVMGAAADEEERENLDTAFRGRSQPARRVTVQSFAAAKFELTRREFRAFAEATGHRGDSCFVWNGNDFELDPNKDWRNPGYAQDDAHPVVCVSWDDAQAYARWLSRQTGKAYRLLSEAEWEYAARAGTTSARYWGDDANRACDYANGADAAATAQLPAALGQRELQRPPRAHRTRGQLPRQRLWPARHAGQCRRMDAGLLERPLQRRACRSTCVDSRRLRLARGARRRVG
jgi:formylglycine-generating enzyme